MTNLRFRNIGTCWSSGRTPELGATAELITPALNTEPEHVSLKTDRVSLDIDQAGVAGWSRDGHGDVPHVAWARSEAVALLTLCLHSLSLRPMFTALLCLSVFALVLRAIPAHSDTSGAKVNLQVPIAQAPWSCLTNPRGDVDDVYINESLVA